MALPPILLTRPIADAQESKEKLKTLGFEVIDAPVMTIKRIALSMPLPEADVLVLTSPHALDDILLGTLARTMQVYCVGARAATLCRQAGFTVAFTGATSSHLIAALRKARPHPNHILYISGRDVSSDITAALLPETMSITRIISYHAEAITSLSAHVKKTLRAQSPWIVFYSKRSVELFSDLIVSPSLNNTRKSVRCFCLSEAIAGRAMALGFSQCHYAKSPDEEALIAVLAASIKDMV